ncbi:amidase family protein [Starkeya koreensis]|uniref:Amidase family protein n=1 Tax=Ancylobacter koreensis TaxID=266121 RepID=A0ABT0DJN2_9HYPH|nr:amidase [Ancylobacter koreensis]MCK0207503.1 amidase family protein [Ancylobacter koreensis]
MSLTLRDAAAAMSEELTALSGGEQATLIARREISPVELVRAYLARIEASDDTLRAWITVDGERALAAARTAESEIAAGRYRGALHGIPYGVKDQMHAVGFPTTLATRVLDPEEMVAPHNAAVIERLDAAGAILLGKQNLHEFGKGGTIDFPYGQPRNPWNPAYSASSSSTGSGIAPAARMCTFSLGEDTGGSVRGPAAMNGVAGLRPTYGRVSRYGAVMEAYTTDTIGPLARSVADIATVLGAIAGHDPRDPLTSPRPVEDYAAGLGRPLKGRRLAIVREIAWGPGTTDEVKTVFAAAVEVLRGLGAEIEEVSLPLALYAVPLQLLSTDADVAATFVKKYLRERYERFDTGTRTRLAASSLIPATVYNRAMRARAIVRQQVLDAVRRYDALIGPTMIRPTKPIEQEQEKVESSDEAVMRLMERRIGVYPFSLANVPALSVPMGFCANGLPLALQFAGKPFDEATLLNIAYGYEREAGWWRQLPDLERTLAPMAA